MPLAIFLEILKLFFFPSVSFLDKMATKSIKMAFLLFGRAGTRNAKTCGLGIFS